ncbi:MAG TPA: hypothetical protein VF680_16890 [Allosphingosinicella sp.]|jgi:uncharacterized protein YpuA (DUF1002 family)
MKKIDEMKVKRIIHTVGLNNNLTDEQVREIVESQSRLAYDIIKDIDFDNVTSEEIDEMKTNFYFKYIGKIYANSDNLEKLRRKQEYLNKLNKEDGRTEEL